jgi:hypothetical protein
MRCSASAMLDNSKACAVRAERLGEAVQARAAGKGQAMQKEALEARNTRVKPVRPAMLRGMRRMLMRGLGIECLGRCST